MRDELALLSNQNASQYVKDENADYRITLIRKDGTVEFDSYYDEAQLENHLDREEVSAALSVGNGEAKRWSQTETSDIIYVAKRLDNGNVLRIAYKSEHINVVLLEMLFPILLLIAILVALTFFIAKKTSCKSVDPLNNLDLDSPLKSPPPYDEITPLLKRIEENREAREKADRARKNFTANVSHELKTPLQGIAGSVEILERDMVEPQDRPKFLSHIKKETNTMISLVDDIILLSRLDEKDTVNMELVDFKSLVNTSIDTREEFAHQNSVTIFADVDECQIKTNARLIKYIVDNLLDNAIKYNKNPGFVNVNLKKYDDRVILQVRDTGIGISKEEQESIFERFYRVDKSRSKDTGGTGLGLSIVKNAAIELGAQVTLISEIDKGTTVEVVFPIEIQ